MPINGYIWAKEICALSAQITGRTVFDLSMSGRPEGVRGGGGEGENKNKKTRGGPGAQPQNADIPSATGDVTDVTVSDGQVTVE